MSSPSRTERGSGILASAAFRLTLWFASVFVVCLLVLDLGLGTVVSWRVERQARDHAQALAEAARDAFVRAGATGVAEFIAASGGRIAKEDLAIGHQSAGGVLLSGTLAVPGPALGWAVYTPPGVDEDEALWVHSIRLGDGTWISVGAGSEAFHDIREQMLEGAFWIVAIALPLALLSGALLSRAVLARLAPIAATADGVRAGEMSRRAPVTGRGDEFDALASNINAMLEQIEVLTRNLRNVSVGIAHELRTPLARIQNRLVTLEAGIAPESRAVAEGALAEIEGALKTFDALLQIGQIEADAQRKGFEKLNLAELVAELAEAYEPVAAEQGKALSTRCGGPVELTGNRALLAQMISNLLENAIEHTPEGTRITLAFDTAGGQRRLVVEDNGPGIPEGEAARVFERFYRLERSRGSPGNGLGLSLVKSICALHGFALRLIDAGPGARFEITL